MEIIFLGTGGGRFNLIAQKRCTAGFRIEGSLKVHVDPGPGVLQAAQKFKVDLRKTDVLVVTHNHIDHVNDAALVIEAMTNYSRERSGAMVSSRSVLVGDEYGERGVSTYHLEKLVRKEVAQHGKEIMLGGKGTGSGKDARLLPIPVKHEDETGFGFVLEMDGKKLGYTSDTEYYEGIGERYRGCDLLIVNNLKAVDDKVPGHLFTSATVRLLKEAKPKLAVLSHMGMRLIKSGPEKEAEKIGKLSGVKTVSAKDGMRLAV